MKPTMPHAGRVFLLSALCFLSAFSQTQPNYLSHSFFMMSIEKSFVSRTGWLTAQQTEVPVKLADLTTLDLNLGFTKPIANRPLLFRLYFAYGSGSRSETWTNKYYNGDFHDFRLTEEQSYSGLFPELLAYYPVSKAFYPYVFAGAGLSSYTAKQSLVYADSADASLAYYPASGNRMSASFSGGAGAFCMVTYYFGLYLEYKYRSWEPVSVQIPFYDVLTDTKRETQDCNILGLGILLRL